MALRMWHVWACSDSYHRWLDSTWLKAENAKERMDHLQAAFLAAGFTVKIGLWWAWVSPGRIESAKIALSKLDKSGEPQCS